ncbi:MAG: 6-phosphofructokinase [Saprospiraceae bacterium]|nr:6-phosphofructokinase [Candidatus Vicinibacter affinis]MBK7694178.1 6-phosphofructokinase [Candidatus Vicinibacter affinis]MBK7798973.1 6-phosphofructokinase [Candidatus Vicinibacter affinis]MBK8644648.1 6-phosphofructokinase [Candidatus Vicinibacter affinis]MBP6174227.1 6-phosphofructokinase [Saprospiraceae bacterium]
MTEIKRIGVFTSGGDAPGMNAAIRAVMRTASIYDLHVYGIQRGYDGMIDGEINRLEADDVRNILQRGGTILKTARSSRFLTPEGRKIAYENLVANDIDALVAIGGNGTFTGSMVFNSEFKMPTIGLPGTIDNDLYGTDYTIGFDTAVNTAIQAVDKIRDTADSHNRIFLIEVMGRNSGYIALHTAIGSGASAFIIPEVESTIETLIDDLKKALRRKKLFGLVISAEGNKIGNAFEISSKLKELVPEYDVKVTIIGHLQRGGSPTAQDRILASRLGYEAVEALIKGKHNVMAGIINDKVVFTPFVDAISKNKTPDISMIKMANILGM